MQTFFLIFMESTLFFTGGGRSPLPYRYTGNTSLKYTRNPEAFASENLSFTYIVLFVKYHVLSMTQYLVTRSEDIGSSLPSYYLIFSEEERCSLDGNI